MDAFRLEDEDATLSLDACTDENAKRTRKRITSFTAAQFAHQHRNFAFSLLLCGSRARFVRWDYAGAIVTKHFDYHQDSRLLAEFFWRYGQLTSAQRGVDPTVFVATSEERDSFTASIHQWMADKSKRKSPGMKNATDPEYTCHKIMMAGPNGASNEYLVQKPLSPPTSPVGRCTKAYIALDLATNKLVFLKDYWRSSDRNRPAEADVYHALETAGVPHLPRVHVAGDVFNDDGQPQATLTGKWKQEACGSTDRREYIHHRIVQDIAYPLSSVRSSRELVAAIRSTVQCKSLILFSILWR